MRVTQNNNTSRLPVRCICLAGSLIMALALAGCSAASMTGFEFPVFGLTEKSAQGDDAAQTETRSDANPTYDSAGQQRLTGQ